MAVRAKKYQEFSSQDEAVNFLNDCARHVVPGLRSGVFSAVKDEKTLELATKLEHCVGRAVGAFLQFNGVSEELATARKMLKRYPWHGTEISKSSHLEMTWFLIQNLCYHFKEKAKLYFNQQRVAARLLDLPEPNWLKLELKFIDDAMGAAIKDRGNTVHSWNVSEQSIDTYALVEMFVLSGDESRDWDLKSHYSDAKMFLGWKAEKYRDDANALMWRCFREHSPTPATIVARYNEIADAVLKHSAKLDVKETV